ncbi:MAG: hypothetical protein DRP02_12720 [Candidatus Gerdarchaeota archaeon]|nr:MAG: hypothetical protein DRP02_12720 [Candidatus Gerdarchaeota archaeon]
MENLKNISQDGDKLVLKAGTTITPSTGTVASNVADIANDASGTVIATAVNAIIAALEGVGILADS